MNDLSPTLSAERGSMPVRQLSSTGVTTWWEKQVEHAPGYLAKSGRQQRRCPR